ncbi:MAG: YfhO family protein [Crocinitomicaceae bacterium]
MDVKQFFKKNYIHFVAIGLFLIVGLGYFSMQFSGYSLIQHDIESHKGASAELNYNREVQDVSPDWSNSMFGGMPVALISSENNGNLAAKIITAYRNIFDLPFGSFLLHLICFYIFAMCMRIKPLIAILGAFAFAFASYEIVILQAGHNTKSIAVAFLPAVLGAFIYTFRRNWKIGAALSALFMALEVAAGHPQVTYYMGFLLLFIGIYFFIEAIKKKELKRFGFATAGIVLAYIVAGLTNYGQLTGKVDYVNYSTRGTNDVKVSATGEENRASSGLEIDYITNWSLDRGETFTFVSPYVRGSHSGPFVGSRFEGMEDDLELEGNEAEIGPQLSKYWGMEPGVAGPFYMGVIVVLLALLALVFVRKPLTYILFGTVLFMLFLSWGKNLLWLTEFFVENVPLYDTFRTVTIILVIVELCLPVLAVLLLQHLYENREDLKPKRNQFFIASGAFLLFLFILKFSGSGFTGLADQQVLKQQEQMVRTQIARMDDQTAAQNGIDKNNAQQITQIVDKQLEPIREGIDGAKKMRKEMYAQSTNRSILFALLGIGICSLFFLSSMPSPYIIGGLAVVILMDMVPVNLNYLGSDEGLDTEYKHWMEKEYKRYPIATTQADEQIYQLETQGNSSLLSVTQKGAKYGEEKAEDMGYEGDAKRRVSDFYRFRALAAATNYRVLDLSRGWNAAWNSSENAYLHKSLGGYHPAKLQNIQNLYDFQLSNNNLVICDMMNVKYIIREGNRVEPNANALGNAWAVKKVKAVDTPDDEIRAIGNSFKVNNIGNGQLLINGKPIEKETKAYAFQRVRYVVTQGDTVNIGIPNEIKPGIEVVAAIQNDELTLVDPRSIELDSTNMYNALIEIEGNTTFTPKEEAVMLKEFSGKLSAKEYSGEASVEMTSFDPDKIEYEVDAKGKQLIVFSEIYYPDGWSATIDGKKVDILKANYLLRALEVDGGKHKVVFEYNAAGSSSSTISWIGSILLLLLLGGSVALAVRSKRNSNELVNENE